MNRNEVPCEIVEADVTDQGRTVRGVRATCSDCSHVTEAFGTGDRSRTYVLVKMREQCPMQRRGNFYVAE